MPNKSPQKGFATVLAIIIIVVVLGLSAFVLIGDNGSIISRPSEQSSTPSGTPGSNVQIPKIQILNLQDEKPSAPEILDNPANCQPLLFDPQTSKYSPSTEKNSLDKKRYDVEPADKYGNKPTFFIRPSLKGTASYTITPYEFGCASMSDDVLEVMNNGNRTALYTHASGYRLPGDRLSGDGTLLFLSNLVQKSDGRWEKTKRIITVQENKKTSLPNLKCVSDYGRWNGQHLITNSDKSEAGLSFLDGDDYNNYLTDVCVWDATGQLLHKLQGNLTWYGASRDFLWGPIGVLSREPDIFYAYLEVPVTTNAKNCAIFLQDMTNQSDNKIIGLFKKDNKDGLLLCPPDIELDLQNTTFENPTIRYQVGNHDPSDNNYGKLGEWQVVE